MTTDFSPNSYQGSALRALDVELEQLTFLRQTIQSPEFSQACELIKNNKGKLILMGVGKSGHIAKKIAASFASTGTSSFFVHPCEAGHGDAGMIQSEDLVIYISNSGEPAELSSLSPYFQKQNIKVIAITNNPESSLAKASDLVLQIRVATEACPINLAPTSSTTNTLVLGDCLVIAVMESRNFSVQQFATSHPLGLLGRRLLITNEQIMRKQDDLPLVTASTKISDSLVTMSSKKLGCVLVVADSNEVNSYPVNCLGIFTDGDLRRIVEKNIDLYQTPISAVMTTSFITASKAELSSQTLKRMEDKMITVMPIVNAVQQVIGVVHLHDIVNLGL